MATFTGFYGHPGVRDSAPVVVNIPYASQEGDTLTCTMGEWTGEPTEYAYVWKQDGSDAGTGETHTVIAEDAGSVFTCIVTATNGVGSTEAPPSNEVVAEAPPVRSTSRRK